MAKLPFHLVRMQLKTLSGLWYFYRLIPSAASVTTSSPPSIRGLSLAYMLCCCNDLDMTAPSHYHRGKLKNHPTVITLNNLNTLMFECSLLSLLTHSASQKPAMLSTSLPVRWLVLNVSKKKHSLAVCLIFQPNIYWNKASNQHHLTFARIQR